MERMEGGVEIRTKLTVQKLKGAPEPTEPIVFQALTTTLLGVLDDDMVPITDLALERMVGSEIAIPIKTRVREIKLRGKGAHILSVAKQAIVQNRSPSIPDAGASRDEIWYWYARMPYEGEIDMSRSNFNSSIKRLVEKGFLTATEDNRGDVWYRFGLE